MHGNHATYGIMKTPRNINRSLSRYVVGEMKVVAVGGYDVSSQLHRCTSISDGSEIMVGGSEAFSYGAGDKLLVEIVSSLDKEDGSVFPVARPVGKQ
jgi:hypothetical protein